MPNRKSMIKAAMQAKADLVLRNARWLNVFSSEFELGDIAVSEGCVVGIGREYQGEAEIDLKGKAVVPGFIDGHIHLESAMVTPPEFAKSVALHGTTAVIADPHEIANVLGKEGIAYMMQATEGLPVDVFFMAPSCVPATVFDEAGASLGEEEIRELLCDGRMLGLGEMMDFPGVTAGVEAVLNKLEAAHDLGKLVDGHAPSLTGRLLDAYLCGGISTDHECASFEEAVEKLRKGLWIMIREGSAGKNLEALMPLICQQYYSRCFFACDDRHPVDLTTQGHIDGLIRKAIQGGADPVHVYKMASFHAASHFHLAGRGAIAPGYLADLVVLDDLHMAAIHSVYKQGEKVTKERLANTAARNVEPQLKERVTHTVHLSPVSAESFVLKKSREQVIGLVPGQLFTTDAGTASAVDVQADILKAAVVERHRNTGHIGIAFVKGYGLKTGALAVSIAHDSHNIIAIGTNDRDLACAVNRIRQMQGGIALADGGKIAAELPLPVAGLMCEEPAQQVCAALERLNQEAFARGVERGIDPVMTLSFLSLPVIPKRKLTTKGVVDVERFTLL